MLLSILLASPFFVSPVASQLSAYTSWTPEYTRYCEQIQSTNPATPLSGGVACGYTAWNVMSNLYPLKIASTSTLSLINVGWITTEALSSQKGFWKTCKPYMVRLFDGLWSDLSKACTLLVNQPSGFPNCTQDYTGSFLYRSGSGYCMNSKVCGANTEIEFYKNADGSSLLYSWEPADAARFTTLGYTKVGSCYGYGKLANPGSTTTNLENEPPFF